jgi:hypothetical protein
MLARDRQSLGVLDANTGPCISRWVILRCVLPVSLTRYPSPRRPRMSLLSMVCSLRPGQRIAVLIEHDLATAVGLVAVIIEVADFDAGLPVITSNDPFRVGDAVLQPHAFRKCRSHNALDSSCTACAVSVRTLPKFFDQVSPEL